MSKALGRRLLFNPEKSREILKLKPSFQPRDYYDYPGFNVKSFASSFNPEKSRVILKLKPSFKPRDYYDYPGF